MNSFSTHSRHPVLPIEIFEEVVDQSYDNSTSLRQLSLTCSKLLPRTRFHLFTSIIIQTIQQLEYFPAFLDPRPWLLPLVQKITLRVLPDESKRNTHLLEVFPVYLFSRLPNLRIWAMDGGISNVENGSRLSFNRSALRCYMKYGGNIQSLQLSSLFFDDISDFIGLLSAFTKLDTLTCSNIKLGPARKHTWPCGQHPKETSLTQSLQIKCLQVDMSVDIRAIKYLLGCSRTTLNSLRFGISVHNWDEHNQIKTLMGSLSGLSSLTLLIRLLEKIEYPDERNIAPIIQYVHRIINSVRQSFLNTVEVEIKSDPISILGSCLSQSGASFEAFKVLEQALLDFPVGKILVHDAVRVQRAGRPEFWSPVIRRALPNLNERGRLTFAHRTSETGDILGHEEAVRCLISSSDSKWIVTASCDATITVWDSVRGSISKEWVIHQSSVHVLALSPDSRLLVSASRAGGKETLVVWDLDDDVHEVCTLAGNSKPCTSCAWSPDGTLIASASDDGTVHIWDGQTFRQLDLLRHVQSADSRPLRLQFSPDGRYLAWTRAYDCCIWMPCIGKQPKDLPSHPSRGNVSVNAVSFDPGPESKRVATAHGGLDSPPDECVVRIWDVGTGCTLAVLAGHLWHVEHISFSPDGTFLSTASSQGSVKTWNTKSGKQRRCFETCGRGLSAVRFSPDGEYIATVSQRSVGRLWRIRDGSCAAVLPECRDEVSHIELSPNGQFLAFGGMVGRVDIHRLANFIGH